MSLPSLTKTQISYTNAKYYGLDLESLYLDAGKKIATILVEKFGKEKSYAFVCGLGGNAGDAMAAAYYMNKSNVKNISIYIVGRVSNFENPISAQIFENYIKNSEIIVRQDSYAVNIPQEDIVIEALVGTGLTGSTLNKRFHDVINRISHFKTKLVAIDMAAPSYTPDLVISLIYPKSENAIVIDLDIPKDISLLTGPGDVKYLFTPKKLSHKLKNGKLLILANTDNTAALNRSVEVSSKYEVFTYLSNFTKQLNSKDFTTLEKYLEFVSDKDIDEAIFNADTLLYSDIDEISLVNRGVLNEVAEYKGRIHVFYKNAIEFLHPEKISKIIDKILILDKEQVSKFIEWDKFLGFDESLKGYTIRNKAYIITPGLQTILYGIDGEIKTDNTGQFYTHEYRDLLASLIAAYSTKNDLWLAMRAAVFTIILAKQLALEKNKNNIEDVINEISNAIEQCRNY